MANKKLLVMMHKHTFMMHKGKTADILILQAGKQHIAGIYM